VRLSLSERLVNGQIELVKQDSNDNINLDNDSSEQLSESGPDGYSDVTSAVTEKLDLDIDTQFSELEELDTATLRSLLSLLEGLMYGPKDLDEVQIFQKLSNKQQRWQWLKEQALASDYTFSDDLYQGIDKKKLVEQIKSKLSL
jgi:hypothetical protein